MARRLGVHGAQRGADVRVAGGAEPGRRVVVARREVLAQHLHQRDVEQAVEQRLLAGRRRAASRGRAGPSSRAACCPAAGAGGRSAGSASSVGRRGRPRSRRRRRRTRSPGRRPRGRGAVRSASSGRSANGMHAAPGAWAMWWRVRLAHEHDVAGHEPRRLVGGVGPQMRLARTIAWTETRGPAGKRTPQSPWTVVCAKAAPRARERCSRSVSTSTIRDDRIWIGAIQAWIRRLRALYWTSNRSGDRDATGRAIRSIRRGRRPATSSTSSAPAPGAGQVVVRVKAAGINPGEAAIREGAAARALAGDVPVRPGQRPRGRGRRGRRRRRRASRSATRSSASPHDRASHAELVVVEAEHLTPRPGAVPWEVAGALFVVGATAYAAVRAVGLAEGDVVAVSGAAGGVGTLAVQLARRRRGDRRRAGQRGPPRLAARRTGRSR